MPPFVALVLCSVFVAYLLRLDQRESLGVSRSLWIPTIWALVAFGKPLGIWFGGNEQGSIESGSPADRIFLLIILSAAMIVLYRRELSWAKVIRENPWILILLVFMLVSISWSSLTFISFKRWTREMITVVMAIMLASERDPMKALMSWMRRVTYVLIPFSILLIKYYPHYGVEYGRWSGQIMWIGVSLQKNGLARLCAVSTVYLIWMLQKRREHRDSVNKIQTILEILILLLTIYLFMGPNHKLTYSATSLITLLAALISLLVIKWANKKSYKNIINKTYIIVIVIIVYGIITPFIGELAIFDISSSLNRNETLTGRSDIWATLIPFALARPLQGYGFGGFWTTEMRLLTSSHSHNGYLDVILNIGIAGLLLAIFFMLSSLSRALKALANHHDLGMLLLIFIVMTSVYNIAESSLESFYNPFMAIVIFMSVAIGKLNAEEDK